MQTQVTNMAKCEEMGALTQWKIHLARRAFLRIESGLGAYDSNNTTVAWTKTATRLSKYSPLGATRQNQQILALCLQQQATQGKWDLLDTCDPLNSIDCKYLRRNEVKACTQNREQKIRQGTSHRRIHRGSSWRRRNINTPPSRKRIVQNALFKQRGVRMTSSKGDYLLLA
jgi:hypothetical protein